MKKTFIILLSLFISLSVLAKDGKVIFSKGNVLVNTSKAVKGSEFSYQDKITVGEDGLAVININPGTTIKLKAGTELIIEKPLKTKSTSSFSYILSKGEIFVKATRTNQNRYNVKTKPATMGVRGTQFFVSSTGKSKGQDWMCVNEGKVEVTVDNVKGTVLVNEGEGVAISGGILPKKKRYKWTKALNWKLDGDAKEIEDKTKIQNINYDLENKEYE
jgi:hypothetical protein